MPINLCRIKTKQNTATHVNKLNLRQNDIFSKIYYINRVGKHEPYMLTLIEYRNIVVMSQLSIICCSKVVASSPNYELQ